MMTKSVRIRPRADDDDEWPLYLGIGSVAMNTAPEEPSEPPALWFPEHRSGSRFGGWKKRPIGPTKAAIGFRPPR